jgi:hypothetical protein
MLWIVVIPDEILGDINITFSSFYKAVLFADPLEHYGVVIHEVDYVND